MAAEFKPVFTKEACPPAGPYMHFAWKLDANILRGPKAGDGQVICVWIPPWRSTHAYLIHFPTQEYSAKYASFSFQLTRLCSITQSQAIQTPAQIYVSGQIPATATGELVTGTIGERTAACIANIKSILEAAGSSIEKVIKVNVFLTDMKNFADMNGEYEKHFVSRPARSCVAVHQLPKGVEVEIECIALP
ncbi:hypothetical protein MMC25_002998 [Agyrium rufum]|nr:hypothetical protein [Agyrium rufum]